jgi:uncharacterized protein with FMN-binding domain
MRRVLLAIVATTAGLVLLLSFKTHPLTTVAAPHVALRGTGSSGPSTPLTGTRTVTGRSVDTPYGPVKVRITLHGNDITDAHAVRYPQGTPQDQQINGWAIPQLDQEAVNADSASIDVVSGATYTSEGYAQSLQSALDKARSS